MIRPTPRLLLLLAAGIPVGLVPVFFAWSAWPVWAAYVTACAALLGYDVLTLARPRHLEVDLPETLAIGASGSAVIRVEATPGPRPSSAEALLDLDAAFEPTEPVPIGFEGTSGRAVVSLVPRRRGALGVQEAWLRWRGRIGLVARVARQRLDRTVSVVPGVARVRREALAILRRQDVAVGSRLTRDLSEGSEFDALREYLPGHDPRAIDWKASARHTRLLVRRYRAERNHQVVVAFDTGHLMAEPLQGIPRLDHAIEAGLLLAYVSLRNGDRVGLFAFDSRVRQHLKPRGGLSAMDGMLRELAALEASAEETNFTLGFAALAAGLPRRSLVVLFTDFVDTVTAELMVESLGRVARRHLVIAITLNDAESRDLAGRRPDTAADVTRAVVAQDLTLERDKVLSQLRRLGIHVIAADPGTVSASLVNRYASVMRRELVG